MIFCVLRSLPSFFLARRTTNMSKNDNDDNLIIANVKGLTEDYMRNNKSRFKGDFAESIEHLKIEVLKAKKFEIKNTIKNVERARKELNSGLTRITQLNLELKKDIHSFKSNVGPVVDGAYLTTCAKTTELAREAKSLYKAASREHDECVVNFQKEKKNTIKVAKTHMVSPTNEDEKVEEVCNEEEEVDLRG